MPNRRLSASVTSTAPTRRSRIYRQASLTVALGGSVTGSWFLTMSDIFRIILGPMLECGEVRLSRVVYCFDLNQRSMNFPIPNPLELGELFLGHFDRLFSARRRPNDDRPLTTAEKLIGLRDFIHETHAIARHLSVSHSISNPILTRLGSASMIWINFAPRKKRFTRDTATGPRHIRSFTYV